MEMCKYANMKIWKYPMVGVSSFSYFHNSIFSQLVRQSFSDGGSLGDGGFHNSTFLTEAAGWLIGESL